jgi:hypothetical protein
MAERVFVKELGIVLIKRTQPDGTNVYSAPCGPEEGVAVLPLTSQDISALRKIAFGTFPFDGWYYSYKRSKLTTQGYIADPWYSNTLTERGRLKLVEVGPGKQKKKEVKIAPPERKNNL